MPNRQSKLVQFLTGLEMINILRLSRSISNASSSNTKDALLLSYTTFIIWRSFKCNIDHTMFAHAREY